MGLAEALKRTVGMGNGDTAGSEATGSDTGTPDLESLRDRFRTGASSGKGRGKRATPSTPSHAQDDAVAVKDLLSPKNVGRLVKLPFDTAFAITGFDGWALDKDEEAVLSTTWAITAQYLVPSMNPGLIALAIASINTAVIVSKKAYMYRQAKKEAAETGERA